MNRANLSDFFGDVIFYCHPDGSLSDQMSASAEDFLRSRMAGAQGPTRLNISQILATNESQAQHLSFLFTTWVQDHETFGEAITALPPSVSLDGRQAALTVVPDSAGGSLVGFAVRLIFGDSKGDQKSEQDEIAAAILEDLQVSTSFLMETSTIIKRLSNETDKSTLKKILHTVKGNCGCYKMKSLVKLIHSVEDNLITSDPAAVHDELIEIQDLWQNLTKAFSNLVKDSQQVVMTRQEYDDLVADLMANTDWSNILEGVLKLPMEPVSLRFRRLAMQVTRIAAEINKEVTIDMNQTSLRLPRSLADFWNALTHIIRNIIDHGIENTEERLAAQKPPSGRVLFRAEEYPDRITISVADDGRGINWEKIRTAAQKRHLPAATQEDLVDALFSEGLSTRETVTTTSGRGVGTSAVKEEILKLAGSIQVESEPGVGTCFHFHLPLSTLANLQLAG